MKGGASRLNAVTERGSLKQGGRGRRRKGRRCSPFSPHAVLPLAKVPGRQRATELGKVAPKDKRRAGEGRKCIWECVQGILQYCSGMEKEGDQPLAYTVE